MRKSFVLGAAALAAMAVAPSIADAGEVKMGGYYMFRMINSDDTPQKDTNTTALSDDANYWAHRLQLNMDFIASPKTHAHMVTRVIDSVPVEGADSALADGSSVTTANAAAADTLWDIRQAWLETEAWGVGLKVGNMPISLHDNILVGVDTTSFGTIMLSKSFGDITLVAANVRVDENVTGNGGKISTVAAGGLAGGGSDDDDEDVYVLSLLGKAANINYQATVAYYDAGKYSTTSTLTTSGTGQDSDDLWLGLTVGGDFGGVDLTGTVLYEGGADNISTTASAWQKQLEGDDFLVALRAKGKTGFGGWNAYGFYAGEDFNSITAGNAAWSPTWDEGGPGAEDLFTTLFAGNDDAVLAAQSNSDMTRNMWGIGAGLSINAGGWNIAPSLDYASVVEDIVQYNGGAANSQADYDSAWGGALTLSTEIDKGTTLALGASFADPDKGPGNNSTTEDPDTMHFVHASVKMKF
ncbi:MAG: hypothetical protein HQL82_08095 [Magnetococcales bacterium]|nr:hypothetical protein [Magnetococcales bacterium]